MKTLILLAGLLAVVLTAPAQTLRWGLKAGVASTSTQMAEVPDPAPIYSGGNSYLYLRDQASVEAPPQPALQGGLSAEVRLHPRWGLGAELLAAYEPLRLRSRQQPTPSGVVMLTFDADEHVYRYSLLKLALPLYAAYQPAAAWQLQLGVVPSLLLDRQVRVTATEAVLQNGQAVAVTSRRKITDAALRPLGWRLLLGVQHPLTPAMALELRLQPALSNLYRTEDARELLVPRRMRQHAISLGIRYALGSQVVR